MGKWQNTHFDVVAGLWLEVTPGGVDGLKIAAPNSLCVAKFDGKPYPMTGAADGKPFVKDVYKVSSGGKVMTGISTPAATKKPDTIIPMRQ